ncbi:MAG TPA: disulfide bond formation protein DsbA [Rhodospirillaceae bacterium]|nr:disulfide bond formation protein DsbA [Candidatus Neomarinimicrobiota bacterium]HCX14093.1 disulfide bond formation protein DsbA [Rhodospirillaceae bacterium]
MVNAFRKMTILVATLTIGGFSATSIHAADEARQDPDASAVTYKEFVEGDPNAKVTVVEYASLTCSHCANFYTTGYPELKKQYIDTGKIRFVFRDFPTAPQQLATAAAMVARCAPAGRGKTIIGLIFKNQGEFFKNPNDAMRGYAQLAGMTSEDVDACLKNKSVFDEIERVATTAVNVYKVRATPTFFVNDQIVEGEVWETLKDTIDAALADAD